MEQSNYSFADLDLANHMHRLTRAANRANATFYTIDPRGLIAGMDIGEMEGQLDPMQWWDYVAKTQNSLRVLAEGTGGFAVVNNNDFDGALRRIDAETSDYYVIGYYSNNTDPTRWRRQLAISVNRDDVDVWSRTTYELVEPDVTEPLP
jgi:VWFA-related protein